jgi:hypothetical protein
MEAMRHGEFLIELKGVDVAWTALQSQATNVRTIDRRLFCRHCGLEAATTGGTGWPSCCGEQMRLASTRQPVAARAS